MATDDTERMTARAPLTYSASADGYAEFWSPVIRLCFPVQRVNGGGRPVESSQVGGAMPATLADPRVQGTRTGFRPVGRERLASPADCGLRLP